MIWNQLQNEEKCHIWISWIWVNYMSNEYITVQKIKIKAHNLWQNIYKVFQEPKGRVVVILSIRSWILRSYTRSMLLLFLLVV